MRKYLILLVALVMVLGFSGLAMAQPAGSLENGGEASDTISVTAIVLQYAKVIANGETLAFGDIVGSSGNDATASDTFTVESNCDVDVVVDATRLVGPNGGSDTIKTEYKVQEGTNTLVEATNAVTPTTIDTIEQTYQNSAKTYNIDGKATLGTISAQAAGEYAATVTVTVAAATE